MEAFHEFLNILTPIALFIVGVALASFRRTADRMQKLFDTHASDIHEIKVDVATLKEWRNGHDQRHKELTQAIHDLKVTVEDKFVRYDQNINRFYEEYELKPKRPPTRRS